MKKSSGLTLIELMVTMAIIGIGILATIGSFGYITASIQRSKAKTLANNLCQEQIEKLKNLQYYSLLITTSTYSDNRFTPPLVYDTGNYPYQTPIIQGGMTFTRGTRVDWAYTVGNSISTAPWTSDDTGMKLITVDVVWQDETGVRNQEIHNLMVNPAANPLNATFSGTVTDNLSNNVAGALVKAINYPNFYANTNSGGLYSFKVSSGNYTLECSSQGYFSQDIAGSVASGGLQNISFTLTKMSSGTITGNAYLDNHLVISQVVAATGTVAAGNGLNQDVEYIELYNPTPVSILIGTNSAVTAPNVTTVFWDGSNNGYIRRVYYGTSTVQALGYYLISNTGVPAAGTPSPAVYCSTFTVAGVTMQPDACWQYVLAPNHAFECGSQLGGCSGINSQSSGGISLVSSRGFTAGIPGQVTNFPASKIDSVAWSKNHSAAQCPSLPTEGTCITNNGANGIAVGEVIYRLTHPGSMSVGFGRAFDSNNNTNDFVDLSTIFFSPYSSVTTQPVVSGTPAQGAYVTSNDPLSQTATCDSAGFFNIPGVATGTWTIAFSTFDAAANNAWYLEESNVVMTPSLSTGVPNGATSPTWPVVNFTNALINSTTNNAFISGVVTDINNNPISGIQILAGGRTANTGSNGRYFISVSTGDVFIIANNGNLNKAYASQSSDIASALPGVLYDNPPSITPNTWFQLPLAGTLVGYFQTGSNTALPGQTLVALNGGNQVAQAVSDNSGHAFLANLSTGTYTLQPSVDPLSIVNPASVGPITLSSTGTSTNYSTFTVTSGLAQITGQVLSGTNLITTGVLVLASTVTLASVSTPPTINGSVGALCNPCYYGASSDATGQYTVYVRSSGSPYQLYGWYTTFSGAISSTTPRGPYSINVNTAGSIQTQNIVW